MSRLLSCRDMHNMWLDWVNKIDNRAKTMPNYDFKYLVRNVDQDPCKHTLKNQHQAGIGPVLAVEVIHTHWQAEYPYWLI